MKILITGGASGLGESITRLLANDDNNTVYFTYSKSISEAKALETQFNNTKGIACNFSNDQSVKEAANTIAALDLYVIIHNAYSGDYLKTHFHKIASADFLTDFKVNVMPVIEFTQVAITNFRKKKSGKIITVLSAALADTPPVGSAVYCANKAYLQKMTQVWANENEKFNITSNSVSPAFMETAMTRFIDDRVKEQIIENNPIKRLLTKQEVAEAIRFLVNDSSHINGKDFIVSAGSSIK